MKDKVMIAYEADKDDFEDIHQKEVKLMMNIVKDLGGKVFFIEEGKEIK